MALVNYLRQHIHSVLMIFWALLILPTVTLWRNSISWLNFMSIYAIIAAHAAAREGKKAQ